MDRTRPLGLRSLDEYLAFEEQSPMKHEYVGGEVYAMSGVKLRAAVDRIYYPDVIVACGKAAQVELIVEEPTLVVEVTSPSTRATDRREKLDAYRRIPALGTRLKLDDVYDDVPLPPLAVGEGEEWEDYGDEEAEDRP